MCVIELITRQSQITASCSVQAESFYVPVQLAMIWHDVLLDLWFQTSKLVLKHFWNNIPFPTSLFPIPSKLKMA